MKKYWVLLFIIVFDGSLKAQVDFGIGGNILISSIDNRSNTYGANGGFDFRDSRSWKTGGMITVPVSGRLLFMPQLNLVRKGGDIKQTFRFDGADGHPGFVAVEGNARFTYLEIPLNIVYITGYPSGFCFGAGPFIGYGLGGKINCKIANTSLALSPVEQARFSYRDEVIFDGRKETYGVENYVSYRAWEAGISVLAGYRFGNGLFLNAQFNKALNDMDPDSGAEVKNRYYGIGLTYFMNHHASGHAPGACRYMDCK